MTTDIDALITAASSMKEAINSVGDRFGLPNGWLNADFQNTSSYSPKLVQFSEYYKTYSKDVENDTKSIYIDQKTKPLYTAYTNHQ